MASNSFGKIFRISTFGESHGKAIGVMIDGCPAGLQLEEKEIHEALQKRAPGKNPYTTARKEADKPEILSGVFEGKTTGAPICILIMNEDVDSSKYEPIKEVLRPGHANFTYLEKYGIFDYKGGGRASARETACRVAAGAIAEKFLKNEGICLHAYIKQIGGILATVELNKLENLKNLEDLIAKSPLFCPDVTATQEMCLFIEQLKNEGDSTGGVVEFLATSVPNGLGSPVYEKLEAVLAFAMLSIPAAKGFEIGAGFDSVVMPGSCSNDLFTLNKGKIETATNHAGGILGGISNGMPIIGRVAFKATSSIMKPQESVTIDGKKTTFELPVGSRHDPCVAIRAVAVVKAMAALVLADAILLNRSSKV